MLISDEYRALNADLHARKPGYGSKGHGWATRVRNLASELGAVSILDYGCGKGTLARALPDLDVRGYDPAVPGCDAAPEPADLVICTDVLEHVEPECIDAVLADLVRLTVRGCLVAVACRPGKRTLADGRPDHLTVEPPAWWMERLRRNAGFEQIEARRDREVAALWRR